MNNEEITLDYLLILLDLWKTIEEF